MPPEPQKCDVAVLWVASINVWHLGGGGHSGSGSGGGDNGTSGNSNARGHTAAAEQCNDNI